MKGGLVGGLLGYKNNAFMPRAHPADLRNPNAHAIILAPKQKTKKHFLIEQN